MKDKYIPGRTGRYPVMTGYFILFLLALAFYGCAAMEKPPLDDGTFLQERARNIRESGQSAYAEGDYQRALLRFREALAIDLQINEQSGQISDLIGMGKAYTELGSAGQAEIYITKAVKKSFLSRDDKGLSRAYTALARSYLKSRKYIFASRNINDAIRLERAGGREPVELFSLAGLIYLEAGRLDEAEVMIENAIKAVVMIFPPASTELADTYRTKARILSKKGDINSALSYFSMAYDVDAKLEDEKKMAFDLWSAALVLIETGRYNDAIRQLKSSFLIYRKGGFLDEAVKNLDKLVEVYSVIGDKKSVSYYLNMREALLADMR